MAFENVRRGTYLDAGSNVVGQLTLRTAARIDGVFSGNITANDKLTIGESAHVTAHINATSVDIAGKVRGDIFAIERIEFRPTAHFVGKLSSPILIIEAGAVLDGHC